MNMKRPTKKQRQWLWLIGLWCGSLSAFLLVAQIIRWMVKVS